MFLLALDTATPAISAALAEVSDLGVRILAQRVTVDARAHAELLTPQIEAVLAEAGVKPADLSAIAAGVGPGPYTGLRVGLMTAATMGAALGVPVYGVSTLDVIGSATTGLVLVATDARRREVYWAVYRDGVRADSAPAVGKPADVAQIVSARGVTTGVGEGAAKYAEVLGITPGELRYPPMAHLARLVAGRVLAKAPSEPLTPLYLRRPDAEAPTGPAAATPGRAAEAAPETPDRPAAAAPADVAPGVAGRPAAAAPAAVPEVAGRPAAAVPEVAGRPAAAVPEVAGRPAAAVPAGAESGASADMSTGRGDESPVRSAAGRSAQGDSQATAGRDLGPTLSAGER